MAWHTGAFAGRFVRKPPKLRDWMAEAPRRSGRQTAEEMMAAVQAWMAKRG